MGEPTKLTIKRLFALSGNFCTFPSCSLPMVEASGTITGQICHIQAQSTGGPRFSKKLSEKKIHAFENLILMCGHHHKVIDAEPDIYTVDSLLELKEIHESAVGRSEHPEDAFHAQILLNTYRKISVEENSGNLAINSPGAVQGQNIIIKTAQKTIKVNAPLGSIGSDVMLSQYISYLIKRYNEFASKEPSRKTKFSFGAIPNNIIKKFGAKWQFLELKKANEVISYLQNRINKTRQARINKGKNYSAFLTFEQYVKKHSAGDI